MSLGPYRIKTIIAEPEPWRIQFIYEDGTLAELSRDDCYLMPQKWREAFTLIDRFGHPIDDESHVLTYLWDRGVLYDL